MQQFLKLNQTHCASTQLYRVWCADFHTENTCIRTYQLQFAVCFLWLLYDAMLASMNYIKWRERAQSTATIQRRLCQQKCIKQQQQQQPATCKIVITTRIYELTNNCNIHIGQPHCNSQQFQRFRDPQSNSRYEFAVKFENDSYQCQKLTLHDHTTSHLQSPRHLSHSFSLPPSPLSISPFHLPFPSSTRNTLRLGVCNWHCNLLFYQGLRPSTDGN